MSLVDKVSILRNIKEGIRLAIIEKGVECDTTVPFTEYEDKIMSIKTGKGDDYSTVMPQYECIKVRKQIIMKRNVSQVINNKKQVSKNATVKSGISVVTYQ